MSMNSTPASERAHIAFFGVRNAGKSSLVNAVTGQDLSVVSDTAGTTTDPVRKTMELLPLGPVVIIDTPGIDDSGALGDERVRRARRILDQTDIAVLVVSAVDGAAAADMELVGLFHERKIPFVVAYNKADLLGSLRGKTDSIADASCDTTPGTDAKPGMRADFESPLPGETKALYVSAKTGAGVDELKETLAGLVPETAGGRVLVSDIVSAGDTVVLVIPIDKAAPKGRLILPQQMVIRALLDAGAHPLLTRDTEYKKLLASFVRHDAETMMSSDEGDSLIQKSLPVPALVITDSQVFERVSELTPEDIPLTSFSILMARYRGTLDQAVEGARKIAALADGDTVLISEGCTHHRQCDDIGTVKLPGWLTGYTGRKLNFEYTSGGEFPADLSGYSIVIHCGGCMLNDAEMASRAARAAEAGVPFTNFGTAIALMRGILDRALTPV